MTQFGDLRAAGLVTVRDRLGDRARSVVEGAVAATVDRAASSLATHANAPCGHASACSGDLTFDHIKLRCWPQTLGREPAGRLGGPGV